MLELAGVVDVVQRLMQAIDEQLERLGDRDLDVVRGHQPIRSPFNVMLSTV